MKKARINISNILKNQLPNFVKEEYPLVEELFSEYYKGQEYQGGILDILQNIDQYIKLDNNTNLTESTNIVSDISFADAVIPVTNTSGFPDRYGLIEIDSEVILYKSKTQNSFVDCVRGFSGITSYDNSLNFEQTIAENHVDGSVVKNLNILFLNEFFNKVKKQFAPGFENRNFFKDTSSKIDLNENVFIKQLKDFYSSKGTDDSFKILFKSLFNDNVEIIRPRDFLIRPSDAQYRVNKELIIEAIEGDPLDLVDTTIFQNPLTINGEDFISYAYGTVNKVETISRKDKTYYAVSLDFDYNKDINLKGSVYGEFVIGAKTFITDKVSEQSTVITVDSTYGFPETNGVLRVTFDDGLISTISYQRKNLNQFIGCSEINREIPQGNSIYLNYYCEGGNTVGNDENPIKFRITGVLSEATTSDDSHYIVEGNRINLRTLGKDIREPSFNNWKFNIAPKYNVKSIIKNNTINNTYLIEVYDEHIFYKGDSVKLISSRPQLVPGTDDLGFSEFFGDVQSVDGKFSFTCAINFDLDTTLVYEVEREINKFNFSYNSSISDSNNNYVTDVQNVYRDSEGSLYVASQSLPTYTNDVLPITDDTIVLSSSVYISEELNQNDPEKIDKILNIGRHTFKTGDAVYYQSGDNNNKLNLSEGIYYVKVVGSLNNPTQIKLSSSRTNIDNNIFLDVSLKNPSLTGSDNKLYKSTNEIIYFQNSLKNSLTSSKFEKFISPKNLIKKINNPLETKEKQLTSPGQTGILVNGVEIVNYKSNDFIYYGSIEDIKIKSPGSDYDIITPPQLNIVDKNGSGASAICHISGSLTRIDILNGGFDYEKTPTIEISGGNGIDAEVSPNMSTFEHSMAFSAKEGTSQINFSSDTITFNVRHKFYDGEEIKYDYTQVPLEGLRKEITYYVGTEDDYSVKLYATYQDSIKKINQIDLNLPNVLGTHYLISVQKKSTIGSINIVRAGTGYSNRKTVTLSQNINIFSNVVNIKNHGYQTGEKLVYSTTGSPIVGLATTSEYLAYKVNEDQFKLCEINNQSEDKNFYLRTEQFVNFTETGSGNHIFNYPPISVKVIGSFKNKNLSPSLLEAQIVPAFRGSITSVFVESGGVGYGSSDIINYNRQPDFVLENGTGAELRPIISQGKISEVLIVNGGSQYTALPIIEVVGSGTGAKLLPIISNGSIVDIEIVSSGINYDSDATILNVNSAGSGANFEFSIQSWNVNSVERSIQNGNILTSDIFLYDTKNEYDERMTQITHLYAPRKLRENLIVSKEEGGQIFYRKDIENDTRLDDYYHSPIIGWAYDGNPIYGPFGYENPDGSGLTKKMKTGYGLNISKPNRPSINLFPAGFFVEDYDYIGNGDLDEYNGRFCATPEFPNGTYAYFATLGEFDNVFSRDYLRPTFPYLIGNYYKSTPIEFNFDADNTQNTLVFENINLIRNTTPYGIISKNSSYSYAFNPIDYEEQLNKITRVGNGKIDNINIISGGENYKVGDKITLSEDEFGNKSYAEITKIKGVGISSISVTFNEIPYVEFGSSRDFKTIVGVASTPHQLKDQDVINIIGLNEIFTNRQKNVTSRINVFTNQLSITKNVEPSSVTGIITTFQVSGNLNDYAIKPNDIYISQEGEEIKILNIDLSSSSIRVKRGVGLSTYYSGSTLTEKPRRFEVSAVEASSSDNLNGKIYPTNRELYFNPSNSVGLGTVGLSTTIFLNIVPLNYQVSIDTEAEVIIGVTTVLRTGLIFNNPLNAGQFKIGDYINLVGSSDLSFNAVQKAKVLNVGIGSIVVDYDSTALSGIGVTSFVTKWEVSEIGIQSLYLPNHNLKTGEKITYYANSGTPLGVSTDKISSSSLSDGNEFYVSSLDHDHIGISTVIVGLTTSGEYLNPLSGQGLLYFTSLGSGSYHSFKTNYNVQSGKVIKNVARLATTKSPSLFFNENIEVSNVPKTNRTIGVKYNKENRRLVVNPKSFTVIDVDTNSSSIFIPDHRYSTGDKIIHTTEDLSSLLVNNQIYYVVVVDINNIKLSETYYEAISLNPNIVSINTASYGQFSLVNPSIKLYRNETIRFDLTDKSLSFINDEITYSAFRFNLYKDSNFTERFTKTEEDTFFSVRKIGDVGITNNAAVELRISDKTPSRLYYRFELDNINYNVPNNQLEYIIDDENITNSSTLLIEDSVYSGNYNVYNVGNNFIEYILEERPEKSVYSNLESSISYITDSYSTLGEIDDVKVLSKDRKYRVLPGITSVSTKTGSGAILFPYSKDIGSAKKVKIENIGFDYSSDYSLRPTGNLPQIIQVEPLSIFKDIKVTSIGKNYTIIPTIIVLDGLTKVQDKQAELKFSPEESLIEIIQNSSGLYNKTPYLIPINNSNGFTVSPGSVSFNEETKLLTLTFNTSFNSLVDFPFSIGSKVLLENFKVSSTFLNESGDLEEATNVRGLNSEDYGYALFEIYLSSAAVGGSGASITIDMTPYLNDDEIPGIYSPVNSLGYVVPESYFPTFEITLQKNNFILGEEVITTSGYTGIVEYWDNENEFVSVLSDDKFVSGDKITGKTSNLSGIVGKVEFFDAEYSTNSFSVVQRGWDTNIGFLNDSIQRIHDSDYYQYFSYVLKSKTQFSEWNDPVSSLNHTVGFKKFGTLSIESLTPSVGAATTVSYSELNSVSDLFEVIDLNSYHDFDMVSENAYNLGGRIVSDQIIFNTREIQDYSESIGNRVLMIDDFSNQFNNIPRAERFSIVDKFPIYQNRHRKYFAYVKDKLFFNERQFSIISLIHDDLNGFVNQYGRLETYNELGTFDFVINGDEGQVQFKPFDYEFNDFDIDLVSYTLFDTFVGLGSTTVTNYNIGTIANLSNNVGVLPENSTNAVTVATIPISYRSSKIILTSNSLNGSYRESTELNIIHDGTNVYITEYGKLFTKNINPPVGLATYSAYIQGSNIILDLVPYVGYGSTVEVNVFKLSVRDENATSGGVLSENNARLETGFINIPSGNVGVAITFHNYSYEYGGGYYYMSIQDNSTFRYQSLELSTLNNQTDVYHTQFGSIITDDSLVGLGTFSTQIIGRRVYLSFIPSVNANISIRFYYNGIKTITETDIPPNEVVLDLNEAQIVSFNSDYIGTENSIKRSFDLFHKKLPIMKRTFRGNNSSGVNLSADRVNIPNHYFSTGEEVVYDFGADEPIGIATTTIAGIGITDQLPSNLYIIKVNDLSVRVAASASEALKANPEYLKLTSYGVGSQHSFTGKKGNSRSLITIDNMIQSPIVSAGKTTSLSANVALKEIRVKVNDPSIFIAGDIFKVDDEIMRVKSVGFGSTNTLLVNRFWMGTLPGIHSTGAICERLKGDYNIIGNKINFYDAPYGKVPVVAENPRYDEVDYIGIQTSSSFSGRIFNKSGTTNSSSVTYSDNILLDDLSNEFTGIATIFTLNENGTPVSGISTSNLFVLIKDILQIPNNELRTNNGAFELGSNLSGQTTIVFNKDPEKDFSNIDDINTTNIPSGGIILSVGSTFGGGYQPIKTAGGIAQVNNSGQISSISIGFSGSGYRVSGEKEIIVSSASTVSIGTNIIPVVEERGLFSKFAYSGEPTCNVGIGTSLYSVSISSYNSVLSTITISRNTEVEIPKSTPISIKLNELTAELVDIGVRTESNENYEKHYIGFTTVVEGHISGSLNLINPGIAFTSFYDKFNTNTSISVSSGSTIFYLNSINDIFVDDYISINSSALLKIVGIGNTFVYSETPFGSAVSSGTNVLIRRYSPPEVVFDSPVGYSNIPLVYSSLSGSSGIGTGAKIKISVGEDGEVIDFDIQNSGYGYKKSDILTVPVGGLSGIPADPSLTFAEFKIFVDSIYNTKFSAWSIGDLLVIDNFDDLFDGNRRVFPIKINGIPRSIRAKRGSTLDIQATLIVLYNDILQVPGEGYTFKGGSIITFPEAPKYEDRVSIIFYRGNEEVDVIDVDLLETVKVGDGLRIVNDQKKFNEDQRIVSDVVSSDYANTNPYLGRGISQNIDFLRPVVFSKQNIDLVIDGVNIGKDRNWYETTIYPSTTVIQDIGIGSSEIYVESLKTFFDNDAENIVDKDKFVIKIIDQTPLKGAIATCQVSSGNISSIDLIDGGYGYSEAPKVLIENSPVSSGIAYTMSLTSIIDQSGISTTGVTSSILGETIIGVESDTIAILSGISTIDPIISYVPITPTTFIVSEEIRFEESGLNAEIQSLSTNSSNAVGVATITDGVVTGIDIVNAGYGYTYGPIKNLEVISNGSGYPETLNPSNSSFYNARLKTSTGIGFGGIVDVIIEKDLITLLPVLDFNSDNIKNGGSNYKVGDILEVKTFDNIGVGLTYRNKVLDTPIQFKVTEIKAPLVIIDEPSPEVEVIKNVSFTGDFGEVVGIGTTVVGISSNALIFDLYIPNDSYLRNSIVIGDTIVGSAITISQLSFGDYFVISNSNIGSGVISLRNDGSVIGISTSGDNINNVYQVYSSEILELDIATSGIRTSYINRVTSFVQSFDSDIINISSYDQIYANYSWGKIGNLIDRTNPKEFKTYQDQISGIGSNPIIQRFKNLKYVGYSTVL
jgi:hypothetical protein